MPVDSFHPEFSLHSKQVKRCRDCYSGSDSIKSAGAVYLPRLQKQEDTDYSAYLDRSLFYGATGRTVTALTGVVTYKKPIYKSSGETIPPSELPENVDQLVESTVRNILIAGRHILLVDYDDRKGTTKIVEYPSEALINWFDGVMVLKETVVVAGRDEFDLTEETRYRVLALIENEYTVSVYNEEGDLIESYTPVVRGKPLDFIPAIVMTTAGISCTPQKPPVLDLVDVNLSHYRSSADLEHGRHFTALPTPWVSGVSGQSDQELYIGTTSAWILPDPQSRAGFLEFQGQGLGSLENALKNKESMMSSLSARLFEKDSRVSESAETMQTRQNNESGILSNIARVAEYGVSRALSISLTWQNEPTISKDVITVELSRDYMRTPLGHSDIKALIEAYQADMISMDTFLYNMEQGEKLPPDVTVEDEMSRLNTDSTTTQEK